MIKNDAVVREFNTKEMNNDYYKVVECININDMIKDAQVCPYVAEELLDESIEEYDPKYLGYYINVVEAFDKVFVFVNSYGDSISTVHINKDGTVYGSSQGFASPDLNNGNYYAGDEISYMGKVEPFETDQEWLWNSIQRDCKCLDLKLSKETLGKLITTKKEYLEQQMKLQ